MGAGRRRDGRERREVIAVADLALHVRRHPLERLSAACVAPFEAAELRWPWARRFAYLVAVVAVRD